MKFARIISGLGLSALGLCLLCLPCRGSEPVTSRVDRLFAAWNRADSPGAALVIVKDGAVVYRHGYGCANLEHGIPITPQTVLDAASVAKQFTGLAVAMLAEQGKLSLDNDIRKYLPEVPDFGTPLTLQHLLHHTSGLRDWSELHEIMGISFGDIVNMDTIWETIRRQRDLDFPPGEAYSYSNSGYYLLAAAVARVTGQPFRAWTETNLFQPLGMGHTHFCDDPEEVVLNRAESYAPGGKGGFHHVVSQLASPGSSSLLTTADDLGKWLLNFETGRVGGKAALAAMQQPGKSNQGTNVPYGFGIGTKEYRGTAKLNHTGLWAGYRSAVLMLPEKHFGVGILANSADMIPSKLASEIAELYVGDSLLPEPVSSPAKTPSAAKTDPEGWDAYLGTYRVEPGKLFTVTRDGDQLVVQATGEAKFKMTPLSNTNFFVKGYGAPIEFVRKSSGTATHLIYRGLRAPKLEPPPYTPEQLGTYAGDYWSEELRVIYRLELRDGHLVTWLRSPGWVHLLPTALDHFDTDAGTSIEFTRNSASEITGFKLTGGRVHDLRFVRVSLPKLEPASPKF